MSCRSFPECGYVIKAADFIAAVRGKGDMAERMEAAIEDFSLNEFVDTRPWDEQGAFEALTGFPFPYSAYRPSEDAGDIVGDLEDGEWYFIFDEADLFVLKPTKEMEALTACGLEPVLSAWATFG